MVSKSLYGLRVVALHVSYPLIRSMVRCYCCLKRYRRRNIKSCTFQGSDEWILMCEAAMQLLREKDPSLAEALESRDILFFAHPRTLNESMSMTYGIGDFYCSWKDHGIMLRLVHVAFRTHPEVCAQFLRNSYAENLELLKVIKVRAQFWIAKHDFPDALIRALD